MMTIETASLVFANSATGILLGASTWLGLETHDWPPRMRWIIPLTIVIVWGVTVTWITINGGADAVWWRRSVNGAAQLYVAYLLFRHAWQESREPDRHD